jgi:hypothetical protein
VPLGGRDHGFFQTGIAPVSPKETIEVFAFMEAADANKTGHPPTKISDVLKGQKP